MSDLKLGTIRTFKDGAFGNRPGDHFVYIDDLVRFLLELEITFRDSDTHTQPEYVSLVKSLRETIERWKF